MSRSSRWNWERHTFAKIRGEEPHARDASPTQTDADTRSAPEPVDPMNADMDMKRSSSSMRSVSTPMAGSVASRATSPGSTTSLNSFTDTSDLETETETETEDEVAHLNAREIQESRLPFLYPVPRSVADTVPTDRRDSAGLVSGCSTPRLSEHPEYARLAGSTISGGPISMRAMPTKRPSLPQAGSPGSYRTVHRSPAPVKNLHDNRLRANMTFRDTGLLSRGSVGGTDPVAHSPTSDPARSPLRMTNTSPHTSAPPTPSLIALSRRGSLMAGQPTMWMTSNAPTPLASRPGSGHVSPVLSRTPSVFYSPYAADASRDTGSWISRPPSPIFEGAVAEGTSSTQEYVPLWKRRATAPLQLVAGHRTSLAPNDALHANLEDLDIGSPKSPFIMSDPLNLLQHVSQSLNALNRGSLSRRSSRLPPLHVDWSPTVSSFFSKPAPKDGEEELPSYVCTAHIEGFLPRKMELDAPHKPAADRAWTTYYFVLHGTQIHVYNTDISRLYTPGCSLARFWELMPATTVHVHPKNQAEGAAQAEQRAGDAPHAIEQALKQHHVHTYMLLNGECGLATDYTKREHVIRVRLERQQFLLQLRNDAHVVDWIEALHAGINVCTDLDERPMPKFHTLPRRRRRRRGSEAVALHPEPSPRSEHYASRSPAPMVPTAS
ncbi:hypothetical protein MVES1_000971 [Malassezia vespertilionis]|uniref:uncharacterized protein n=1 Tax=Malassezia vespertilionis TaxID=2020962 RepID=UPI0024B08044|nr:uncharacterized protein MVES1_000971 [Malassezia vespertilionis]WFD05639.1 hypothetical protein MVES1_000971 [Malassezia vespertilionis]